VGTEPTSESSQLALLLINGGPLNERTSKAEKGQEEFAWNERFTKGEGGARHLTP